MKPPKSCIFLEKVITEVWTAECTLIKLRPKFRYGFKKLVASSLEVLGKPVLGIITLG